MTLHIHKIVAALPSQLEPNALYAVRAGVGFDLYLADSTGTVAHRHNGAEQHQAMTQAEYDALPVKEDTIFYYIQV